MCVHENNSGVAVLSCTDCSGSSTASSDITDPGSPFSTASSHSEDSASQPAKMPPTQTAHHPPWPWTAEEAPPVKRQAFPEKTAFSKRLKTATLPNESNKQSPPCLNSPLSQNQQLVIKDAPAITIDPSIARSNNIKPSKVENTTPKMQQGKITEYFKSQVKLNGLKKEHCNLTKVNQAKYPHLNKLLVSEQLIRTVRKYSKGTNTMTQKKFDKKVSAKEEAKKLRPPKIPRKILPAPSKIPENITINNQLNHMNGLTNFAPTVTLTAVSFPPNLTYLHTKTPKPPDIFVPQFATITNDHTIPTILNRTPCLNVIQPVQEIATINNFNCVKLNATVVPIVKLNTLSSNLNGTSNIASVLSVETAVPTVLTAKPKVSDTSIISSVDMILGNATPKQHGTLISEPVVDHSSLESTQCRSDEDSRTEEPYRTEECQTQEEKCQSDDCGVLLPSDDMPASPSRSEKSPSPDSDSGISMRECLEVSVSETVTIEQQKSPILSQPKTIRFPAKKDIKDDSKEAKPARSAHGLCRWAECNAQFDTSGALLEHLQVKHVISQATQEQYVCLWLGCKVHGRTSCSRSWLERHVLAHAGTKPFRCIVDGCGHRFNSQLMLERHVNGHFNTDGNQNGSAKKSTDSNCSKLFKRNGKRIRFRRQPWSARMFDFIDPGIMEGLQHKLLHMTHKRTLGNISSPGDTVNLQSQILARRIEPDGSKKVLVKWHPVDIAPDEWMNEMEYKSTKTVSIPTLHPSAKDALCPSLFPPLKTSITDTTVRQKHRRKPVTSSKQQT